MYCTPSDTKETELPTRVFKARFEPLFALLDPLITEFPASVALAEIACACPADNDLNVKCPPGTVATAGKNVVTKAVPDTV